MGLKVNWEDYSFACGYDREKPSVVKFIGHAIKQKTLETVCEIKGHNWEDHSHAGPESGSMDMYCERCGLDFHQILY